MSDSAKESFESADYQLHHHTLRLAVEANKSRVQSAIDASKHGQLVEDEYSTVNLAILQSGSNTKTVTYCLHNYEHVEEVLHVWFFNCKVRMKNIITDWEVKDDNFIHTIPQWKLDLYGLTIEELSYTLEPLLLKRGEVKGLSLTRDKSRENYILVTSRVTPLILFELIIRDSSLDIDPVKVKVSPYKTPYSNWLTVLHGNLLKQVAHLCDYSFTSNSQLNVLELGRIYTRWLYTNFVKGKVDHLLIAQITVSSGEVGARTEDNVGNDYPFKGMLLLEQVTSLIEAGKRSKVDSGTIETEILLGLGED